MKKDEFINPLDRQEMQDVDTHLRAIEAILAGKLASLTPEERQQYGSVNEQNKLFINKAKELLFANPQLASSDMDLAEFEQDYQMRGYFENKIMRMNSLVRQMESSKMLHDYDNMRLCSDFYDFLKYQVRRGIPGSVEACEILAKFFEHNSPNKNRDNTPTTPIV